jgi:hypothetical protein
MALGEPARLLQLRREKELRLTQYTPAEGCTIVISAAETLQIFSVPGAGHPVQDRAPRKPAP